jgi:hypothetical protein
MHLDETTDVVRTNGAMRILIRAAFAAMLAASAQARTPDKVDLDDASAARIQNETPWPDPNPEVAATRPWLMQVTFFYSNEKPLLGGGDRFASREDCELARRRFGSQVLGAQNSSKRPIGIVVNCVLSKPR